jgi:phage anti-repressor protein
MEIFIKKHTTLPEKFIKDFYFVTEKAHSETDISIDFELIAKWLDTRKDTLKEVLVKKFEKDYDYSLKKLTKSTGGKTNNYIEIKITSSCFKELCMISQTEKAKQVRKYFLEMEKIVKRYHEIIQEKLNEELGLLKKNQKPKLKKKQGGVVYIVEAMNTETTLYKIGKSKNIEDRLKTYNTGNANDIDTLFELYVKDKDAVELCVKNAIKKFQYRKYKEVYEADLQMLKEIVVSCDEFSGALGLVFEKYETKTKKQLQRMKDTENKLFIIILNYDADDESETKAVNKKTSSKEPMKKNITETKAVNKKTSSKEPKKKNITKTIPIPIKSKERQ